MNVVDEITRNQMKPKDQVPQFNVGDTVRVHFRIVEGEKERVQVFEGVVIGRKGGEGPLARFTVRRLTYNEGVERVFPLHSPRVESVEVIREGRVRRAKLHYLRERSGKAARVRAKGRSTGKKADEIAAAMGDPTESPETGTVSAESSNTETAEVEAGQNEEEKSD